MKANRPVRDAYYIKEKSFTLEELIKSHEREYRKDYQRIAKVIYRTSSNEYKEWTFFKWVLETKIKNYFRSSNDDLKIQSFIEENLIKK